MKDFIRLNKYIKEGKEATYKDFGGVVMYYPPMKSENIEKNKPKSIGEYFTKFLSDILTSLIEYSGRHVMNTTNFI